MTKVRSWAGLDVHARSVLAVTLDAESGELRSAKLAGETAKVVQFLAKLPAPTRVAYEAGPTGYGLARALVAAGIGCVVAAPGKIERPAQDKLKTDRRDAERVLRLLMIGALHAVRVPTVEEEALRDLVRAREDVRGDLMRARQRLSKLLLRHGILYEDTSSTWTQRHRAWLRAQDLGGGAQATLLDYLGAIDTLELRRGTLERTISELVPASPYAQTVARPPAASHSSAARKASPRTSSRSAGKPSNGCTASGDDSPRSAASAARSSRSPSPANSPGSA